VRRREENLNIGVRKEEKPITGWGEVGKAKYWSKEKGKSQ
jgi:hypothetical protein